MKYISALTENPIYVVKRTDGKYLRHHKDDDALRVASEFVDDLNRAQVFKTYCDALCGVQYDCYVVPVQLNVTEVQYG